MDTTQYTIDLEGARKYFADLTEMLDMFDQVQGELLRRYALPTGDCLKGVRPFSMDIAEIIARTTICNVLSGMFIEQANSCISFLSEIAEKLSEEEDRQQDRDNE
jgi:hypothetical protein